ncbi:MAG TPA: MFS transporter [Dactylosporangium sp.]|nr:MFS transporter [Dactylosporangium sp.]
MTRESLWRNRAFLALWGGQIVSTVGSHLSATAMALLVLATTGSPGRAGLVAAAGTLPHLLLSLPAGTLVDRWPRRRVMLAAQIVAGIAMGSVAVAVFAGTISIAHLAVAAFVDGACAVCFGVAERAALPQIVPGSLVAAALAQNEAKTRGAALAGPPLGGVAFGLGRAVPFVADAVSYAVAAACLLLVRDELRPVRNGPPTSPWQDTVAGLRYLRGHAFARTAVVLVAASNLVFQALILVLIVQATRHGATSAQVGLMLGLYSGGGLLGAVAATRLYRHITPRAVVVGVNWVWAALLPLFALTGRPVLLGAIGAACAFVGPLWNVVIGAYTLTHIPDELRGRVMSAALTVSAGVLPLGSLAGGALVQAAGPVRSLLVLFAAMLAVAVAGSLARSLRELDRRDSAG